jgi:hypothetical protein
MVRRSALVLATLLTASGTPLLAQGAELTAFGGFQFGGQLQINNGKLDTPSDPTFGGILSIPVRPGTFVELIYNRQTTELQFVSRTTNVSQKLFDMAVEYYHVGGLYEGRQGPVRPFGTASLGLTHLNPSESGRDSEWRVSGSLGLGAKTFTKGRVGLRFQGRLWFTFFESASNVFCSNVSGCLVGLSGELAAQSDLTAGLILAF